MARFISLASAKGGVGRTTCAINLANALRILGKNTVVVDVNQQSPHIHTYLGAGNLTQSYLLKDALDLSVHPYHAIHRHSCGLKVLPNRIQARENKDRHNNIVPVLSQLNDYFDFVILDTSAGFSQDMIESARLGESILVTTPDIVSVSEAIKTKNMIEHNGYRTHGIIVNKHTDAPHSMSINDIQQAIDTPFLGKIAFDDAIMHSASLRQPVNFSHPTSTASHNFISLAKNIIGR